MMDIMCPLKQCLALNNNVFVSLKHFGEVQQVQIIVFLADQRLNLLLKPIWSFINWLTARIPVNNELYPWLR
ncbi:hypothetical protein N482_24800 [Pseudoalteromonas luteoviolacea NCIMB 1942]|uniref:Uncharacterized protein n=1 Tax=Pseudoalteromonas luteoviolacea NCIMB 1942 TaxID=1365253 RepID=A0A161YA37_9GAMM|nr:hypothetical protein N482_24800 [Pseudoalteromonas luteoviolacea NCIMB 1942]